MLDMFRSFIYLDEEKMYSYLRQIDSSFKSRSTSINRRKTVGGNIGTGVFGLNAGTETEECREVDKDIANDYDLFEKKLAKLDIDDYFDCVLNDGVDLATIPQMSILRINAGFDIPEEFDIFSVAQKCMPFITSQIDTENDDEKELMETFLNGASADIPIIIDDDIVISSRLRTDYLKETYAELEEYSDQPVFILCKVIGIVNKEKVEIFNPLKDFIKLPRSIRRSGDLSKNEGLESIKIDGPVLKVEVIGIYK